MTTLYKTEIAL